jgi:TRAP-type C4-dicarboxylate transport system permease small subunit
VSAADEPVPAGDPPGWPYRLLRGFERAVALLSIFAAGLGALLLAAILATISYSVMMRYFFATPQPWVDEAAGWLLVGSAMLAIGEVQRRGDHIGIDLLARRLARRGRWRLATLGVLMVLATALLLVREGVAMVQFSRMLNVLSNQLPEVPLWLVQGLVPAGFLIMALVALVQLACLLAGLAPRGMGITPREDAS